MKGSADLPRNINYLSHKPKCDSLLHSENWLALNPGYLLGKARWGNPARPDL